MNSKAAKIKAHKGKRIGMKVLKKDMKYTVQKIITDRHIHELCIHILKLVCCVFSAVCDVRPSVCPAVNLYTRLHADYIIKFLM